ncbi:uncharacterized protein LOC143567756 [Bidens hawaiensis]|uniref:uncharacterized protein LOC143567756 n=1 Tax=Bidens hawaiensis TaxID=980011 RepID=UPI0040491CAA
MSDSNSGSIHTSPTLDSSNPLYLHPSDHPGLVLVSKNFDGTGFGVWKRAMTIALSAKNKLTFVNGDFGLPADSSQISMWKRYNDMVISWILNTLSPEISASVLKISLKVFKEIVTLPHILPNSTNWDELSSLNLIPSCTCGTTHLIIKRDEDQRLVQFLMGLNPCYESVRGNILMMQHLPSINQAYALLIQDEKQREIHSSVMFPSNSASMNVNSQAQSNQYGRYDKKSDICSNFKRTGHHASKCYRLIGFPKDFKFTKSKRGSANMLLQQTQLPKESTTQSTSISYSNFAGPSMKKPLALGDLLNGLYIFKAFHNDFSCNNSNLFTTSICNSVVNSNVWHHRLGHLPSYKMKQLNVLSHTSLDSIDHCHICPKARQHRLSFPHSHRSSNSIFDLIHIDIWGPYHISTYNGFKYFLTIVDDFSRTTWTHLLATKAGAFPVLQGFVEMVATQFNTKIKCIRSDNAFELGGGNKQAEYFRSKGILHQTICVHVHQQNGVVERKHKHLLETSRALLFQSKLPLKFWGDCVLTATHLINLFPTTLLDGKTPYEVLTNKVPTYDYLKHLVVFAMLPLLHMGEINLNLELYLVSLLDIPLVKRDINCITYILKPLWFLGM